MAQSNIAQSAELLHSIDEAVMKMKMKMKKFYLALLARLRGHEGRGSMCDVWDVGHAEHSMWVPLCFVPNLQRFALFCAPCVLWG